MLKKYQKSLGLICNKFKRKHKDIIDIVLYGSLVKGKIKSRDIDIMVIFLNTELKTRLEIIQELKRQLRVSLENVDVKSMNFSDFFDPTFLARQGILIEGISLIDKKSLAEKLGFKSYAIFTYNLANLSHTEKIKFNYALNGRKGTGVLQNLKGMSLGKGVVQVPITTSLTFEEFLEKWNIQYKIKHALISFYV